MSQLSHAQFPLRRHPNLLVDHRRSRSAAVAEPRGANGQAVTGSGGRLHFGMVADIKSEAPAGLNRNSHIVHLIRNSMDFASWKDRKPIAAELKAIYRATDADVARRALEDFNAGVWGRKYPAIAQSGRRNWEHVIPLFAFPVAVRRIISTTNAIESLNAKLRRAVRTRG